MVVVGKLKTSVWKGQDDEVHSRDVLEATVVGHDLNRGTSAFSRSSRAAEQQDPAPDDEDAATVASLAAGPGATVDTMTGEILDPIVSESDVDATPHREPEPVF